jgi:hypothetical protein
MQQETAAEMAPALPLENRRRWERPTESRLSMATFRQSQVGRPSANGSGASKWAEWRFEVTHISRSWRKISDAR